MTSPCAAKRSRIVPRALSFAPEGKNDAITLELTRDQVKAAPEYKDKQSVVVLGAAGGLHSMPDW